MTLDANKRELTAILHPLAVVLGVGLDGRMAELLMPPTWRQAQAPTGAWVWAGGRVARAPNGQQPGERDSWGLAAAVVLAAEMASEGEEGAYVLSVIRRAQILQDSGRTHRHPRVFMACAPAEIDTALRAAATLLLSGGWVLELGREGP